MLEVNYTEDNSDEFSDWLGGFIILRETYFNFHENIDDDFISEVKINDLGLDCDKSITIRTKQLGVTDHMHIGVPRSNEVWAIKVGNGYLVTDPISISF